MTDPTYALGHSANEHQRLLEQAAILRPMTERLFRAAGIAPGMRVLDVGSGVGDVALLAAELVGPTGEVVGVDLDGAALAKARQRVALEGHNNVRFIETDLRHLTFDRTFDAAVGRLILLYFANPAEALASVVDHVRSGGAVAFHEMDMTTDVKTRSWPGDGALWDLAGRTVVDTFVATGAHARMGRMLIRVFEDAGLPMPSLIQEASVGGGPDYPGYAWLANTMRSVAPLARKLGVPIARELDDLDTLADRIREDAVSRNLMVWSPAYIGAYTRKP